jgi:hypothetical protein
LSSFSCITSSCASHMRSSILADMSRDRRACSVRVAKNVKTRKLLESTSANIILI